MRLLVRLALVTLSCLQLSAPAFASGLKDAGQKLASGGERTISVPRYRLQTRYFREMTTESRQLRRKIVSALTEDFNGYTTTYFYDDMNRLTAKVPDPLRNEPTVSFTYTATGQRETMDDASGHTDYSYDDRDRLLTKAAPAGTLTYTYDDAGNVTSIVSSNAGGADIEYTWYPTNRLRDVIDAHAGTFTYGYDDVGNQTSLAYPNGINGSWTYNENNWLQDIVYTGPSGIVASYSYTTAPTGHRTGVVEHTGRTVEYGYDELYRLTSERVTNDPNSINGLVEYTYDDVGNRLARTSTLAGVDNQAFSYDANDRTEGSTWDSNGNLLLDAELNSYAWSFDDRLLSYNEGVSTAVYDGAGALTTVQSGGATTNFVLDSRNLSRVAQVVEDVNGGFVSTSVLGAGSILGTGDDEVYLTDAIGSVRRSLGGTAPGTWDYDAFGVATSGVPGGSVSGFAGERYVAAFSAYNLRARWYRSEEGRLLSRDPWDHCKGCVPPGRNYGYADVDPVNITDPTGLTTLIEVKFASAIESAIQRAPTITTHSILRGGKSIIKHLVCVGATAAGKAAEKHHILSNKHKTKWTPAFEELIGPTGIDLDHWANLLLVPGHRGRHRNAYHEHIYETIKERLRQAEQLAKEGKLTVDLETALLEALADVIIELADQICSGKGKAAELLKKLN